MKAFLIDPEQPENTGIIEIDDKLDDYYKHIRCELIDIVRRKINGKTYTIVVDDEGIERLPAAFSFSTARDFLFGPVIVTNECGPELVGLMPDDISRIRQRILNIVINESEIRKALVYD